MILPAIFAPLRLCESYFVSRRDAKPQRNNSPSNWYGDNTDQRMTFAKIAVTGLPHVTLQEGTTKQSIIQPINLLLDSIIDLNYH